MYAAEGRGDSEIGRSRGVLRYALAGVEAGVIGALVLMAWLMLASMFTGRSAWYTPNLFATTFFGAGVFRNHFGRGSWTGVASILAVYGILGLFWGLIWRDRRVYGLTLLGALTGLAVYFLLFDGMMPHLNPLIPVYEPVRQIQIGHVLWGIFLARSPGYAQRIDRAISPAPVLSPAPQLQEAEPEVKSGELIQ